MILDNKIKSPEWASLWHYILQNNCVRSMYREHSALRQFPQGKHGEWLVATDLNNNIIKVSARDVPTSRVHLVMILCRKVSTAVTSRLSSRRAHFCKAPTVSSLYSASDVNL